MANNRKKLYILVSCLALMVALLSGTYAYFSVSATNNNAINGTVAGFDLDLVMSRVTTNGNLIPLQDDLVSNAVSEGCLIDDDLVVCQIYEITVSNNGNTGVTLDGTITLTATTGSSISNLKWSKLSDASTYDSSATIHAMSSSNLVSDYYMDANSEEVFYIVVWDSYSEDDGSTMDIGSYTGEMKFSTDDNGVITAKFGS